MWNKYPLKVEKYIIKEYEKGRNTKEIAIELNTYNTTIRRILIRNNIRLRSNKEIQSIVKHNPFANINNKDVQYWLGILATDGCLTQGNRVVLEFADYDRELLEKYKTFLDSPVNINTTNHQSGATLYRIAFASDSIAKSLISYGIEERKSLNIEIKIPITFNFIRGVIDGDGHVGLSNEGRGGKVQIGSCSKKFLEQIKEFLESEGFNPTITYSDRDRRNRYYTLSLFRIAEIKKLYKKLYYKDCYYYMKRKKEKFDYIVTLENKNLKFKNK